MSKELNDYKMNYPANVYQEEEVPLGKIRVWLSLDVNDDPVSAKREAIWDMLTPYKVESWGTSVYTYLDNDKTSSELKKELISNLQEIDIFNKKNWQDTPNISIYVIWRRHDKEDKYYTGYFTLIQNADVSHLPKMAQNNVK